MSSNNATMRAIDGTMSAKVPTTRPWTTTASTPARGASLRRSSRDFCTSTPSKSTRRTTLDPCYGSARHDANATASRRYGADAARVVPQEPSAFLGFR